MNTAPFIPGSATSKAAADAIEPVLNRLQYAVYRFIAERGNTGATDAELVVHFMAEPYGWAESTARARRVELVRVHLVRDSGGRRYVKSDSRHPRRAVVWIPADREPELF